LVAKVRRRCTANAQPVPPILRSEELRTAGHER
jgi:hypothetical protein